MQIDQVFLWRNKITVNLFFVPFYFLQINVDLAFSIKAKENLYLNFIAPNQETVSTVAV